MSDSMQPAGLLVPERLVPVPRSISVEAQAFLSHEPPVGQAELPPLEDKAAWRTCAAEADRNIAAFTARNEQLYPARAITHQLENCPLYEIEPDTLDASLADRAILYIHGGGFFMGGGKAAIYSAMPFAWLAGLRTYSLDYRMPPDHPFPIPLQDALDVYRWLLERYRPEAIAVYGPSAGGNLAAALILKARELGLPLPGACAVHSPASDCPLHPRAYGVKQRRVGSAAFGWAIVNQPIPNLASGKISDRSFKHARKPGRRMECDLSWFTEVSTGHGVGRNSSPNLSRAAMMR